MLYNNINNAIKALVFSGIIQCNRTEKANETFHHGTYRVTNAGVVVLHNERMITNETIRKCMALQQAAKSKHLSFEDYLDNYFYKKE
jgi:hypothetical protein